MEEWQDKLERTCSNPSNTHVLCSDDIAIGNIKETFQILWVKGSGPGTEPDWSTCSFEQRFSICHHNNNSSSNKVSDFK